jgi:hypothetical protein
MLWRLRLWLATRPILAWLATRPIRVETAAAREQLARGTEDWLAWWRASGERELRCILMTAWDPIGVGDAPEAWDEYDDYLPGVASRLRDVKGFEEKLASVSEYLNHLERDFIWEEELTEKQIQHSAYIAESLVAWHEWSYEHGGRPPHEWLGR